MIIKFNHPKMGYKKNETSTGSSTKLTLKGLVAQFRKIFKKSEWQDLRVMNWDVKGFTSTSLSVSAQVEASGRKHSYNTWIVLRRNDLSQPWSAGHRCEVRCNCPAFHYYVANADLKSKNFAGRPSKWNKVDAPIKNPESIPAMCKHLMALASGMVYSKMIKP